jgi:hypothetical protein
MHSGIARTTVALVAISMLLVQPVLAVPVDCKCSRSATMARDASCCRAKADSWSCCSSSSSRCDSDGAECCGKGTERCGRQCGLASTCQCGCGQHGNEQPVAPSESSENPVVELKLGVGDVPDLLEAAASSTEQRLASRRRHVGARTSPSVQVMLCIWLT